MRARLAVGILLLIAAGLSLSALHAEAADPPAFEEAACEVPPPQGIAETAMVCGYVTVPENRNKPGGPTVRLAVAILQAEEGLVEQEPILYLSGGPGGASLEGEMYGFGSARVSDAFLDRDIIFYDQRGTGLSTPKLDCAETARLQIDTLVEGWTPAEQAANNEAAIRACHDRLVDDGVDWAQYSSADSADDIADLMTALGHETFNLYGISYGTRLALTVMRDHPDRVTSAVLDSVYPTSVDIWMQQGRTFERSLDELAAGCAADTECHAAYPDPVGTFWSLVNAANADPIEVTIEDVDGTPLPLLINGNAIVAGAFTAFYDTSIIPLLPFAVDEIANGNTAILTALAQELVFAFSGIADGMRAAVDCNEEIPFFTQAGLEEATAGVHQEFLDARINISTAEDLDTALDLCDDWNTPNPPAFENQPVESDIPTLVFSGQFDPITPPEFGALAAETLPTSYVYEFPATGHGVIYPQAPCATVIVSAFLADPLSEPDASCIAAIPPPDFQVRAAAPPEPTPPPATPTATPPTGTISPPDTGSRRISDERSGWIVVTLSLAVAGLAVGLIASGARIIRQGGR